MSHVETKSGVTKSIHVHGKARRLRVKIVPVFITLATVGIAIVLGRAMWEAYVVAPWTRDSRVRACVVTMAPEVSGRIVEMPVLDNQFVHKGDVLMVIDPTDYRIALDLAEAGVLQAKATAENAQAEAERRRKLTDLAETVEDRETHEAIALATHAQYRQAVAQLDRAKVNLERTERRSPVNGWVTNLLAQQGDCANVGQNVIKLMGNTQIITGEVVDIARGINVSNAQPNQQGLAMVNPIFTWVRLAQRVPVRIRLKYVPDGVRLVAGLTATVQVDPRSQPSK